MKRPVILSYGFRPFFLLASLWSGLSVPLWLLVYRGEIALPQAYIPSQWHAHELIFGYAAAAICGFLLTAIPNWTGRLPVAGAPLALLIGLWGLGRLGISFSQTIGLLPAALLDLSFLAAVCFFALREIAAGRNWRNLRVLVLVALLFTANLWFHLAAWRDWSGDGALRLGVAALLALIILIGGRIIPSFTRNWLAKRGADRLPASFGKVDAFAIVTGIAALLSWVVAPHGAAAALLALGAGCLLSLRLARWRGWASRSEALLTILHLGYAFLPCGFLALAAAYAWPGVVPYDTALHLWTAGAIGAMTLAVMTRASLGHSGMPLTASGMTKAIYLAVLFAALLRGAAPLLPNFFLELILLSGLAWSAAFLGFALAYGPLLLGLTGRVKPPRRAPQPGGGRGPLRKRSA